MSKNNKKFNNKQRCIYSNKIIDGKEVVLTNYAQDYLTKQAYYEVMVK